MGTSIINVKNKAYDTLVISAKEENKARKELEVLGFNFRAAGEGLTEVSFE